MAKGGKRTPAPTKVDVQSRFVLLRAKGYTLAECSQQLGIPVSTLGNWHKANEAAIAYYRTVELEQLYQQYYLSHEAKVKMLGELLEGALTELKQRKMSDLSTASLLSLVLELVDKLGGLYIEPKPLSESQIALIDSEIPHE